MEILILLLALFTKHLVVDFFLQGPFMWKNKGNIWHLGSYAHAGLHAAVTFMLLLLTPAVTPAIALAIALVELVLHYAIDWSKMNLNAKMGWGANTHAEFWWAVGVDQYLHTLTYLGIVAWLYLR